MPMSEPEKKPADQNTPDELKPLTPQQEFFCSEYLKDRNGTQAALRAKYSPNGATETAARLLTYNNVRARINALIKAQLDAIAVNVQLVLRQLLNSALANAADAYDENGALKPICDMPEALQLAITSIETDELYEGYGKDREKIGVTRKVKFEPRQNALKMLGQHLKMFTEVHEIPGIDGIADAIKQARKRAADGDKGHTLIPGLSAADAQPPDPDQDEG